MNYKDITRVEFIDGNGRAFVRYTKKPVELSFQDGDRTLKIFTNEVPVAVKDGFEKWLKDKANRFMELAHEHPNTSIPYVEYSNLCDQIIIQYQKLSTPKCKVTEEEIENMIKGVTGWFGDNQGTQFPYINPSDALKIALDINTRLSSPLNTNEEKVDPVKSFIQNGFTISVVENRIASPGHAILFLCNKDFAAYKQSLSAKEKGETNEN